MNPINPNHRRQRTVLSVIGPIILLIGVGFCVVGFASFFLAFGGRGMPDKFWCAFVGMPLAFVGLVMCKFAFIGKVARYTAGEIAPVGKDTFNYMARETKEGVSNVTEALRDGWEKADGRGVGERIQRLNALKESGTINAEEYESQRKRILSEL